MLTEKEVKSLKPGEYPNHVLRMKFGTKHGSPVTIRVRKNELDSLGRIVYEDRQIIGNRQQRKYMLRNPLNELPDYSKPEFQANRFTSREKQARNGLFQQTLNFIRRMFGFFNRPSLAQA